jgi:hypothetical protein
LITSFFLCRGSEAVSGPLVDVQYGVWIKALSSFGVWLQLGISYGLGLGVTVTCAICTVSLSSGIAQQIFKC